MEKTAASKTNNEQNLDNKLVAEATVASAIATNATENEAEEHRPLVLPNFAEIQSCMW